MRRLTLGILVGLSICAVATAAEKTKTYRSVTWEKFKATRRFYRLYTLEDPPRRAAIDRPSTMARYPVPTNGSSSATCDTAKRASGTKFRSTTLRKAKYAVGTAATQISTTPI